MQFKHIFPEILSDVTKIDHDNIESILPFLRNIELHYYEKKQKFDMLPKIKSITCNDGITFIKFYKSSPMPDEIFDYILSSSNYLDNNINII